jgi:hypothetical protein
MQTLSGFFRHLLAHPIRGPGARRPGADRQSARQGPAPDRATPERFIVAGLDRGVRLVAGGVRIPTGPAPIGNRPGSGRRAEAAAVHAAVFFA